jgi:SAM-dependent methyltransferase
MTAHAVRQELEARAAVEEVPVWYHTLELAPGVVTPGWFDLRPIVDLMPWPDVRGKRCLDIGTYDGFLAFELERRGAAEVVATDIASHDDWDWPHPMRERGPKWMAEHARSETGLGFRVAKELLGSSVERRTVSVYDLDPAELGEFDVVVCGSLLLHLRDPMRALAAIRSVCRGQLLSAEEVDLPLSVLRRRRPAMRFDGLSDLFQWFIPNRTGHVRMVEAAGFSVERATRLYSIPFGVGHPRVRSIRSLAIAAGRRLLTRGNGVPTQAVLARVGDVSGQAGAPTAGRPRR